MSIYYHDGTTLQDALPEDLARVLTPWNYLSVSPAPTRQKRSGIQSSSDSTQTLLDTPSPRSSALVAQDTSHTPVMLYSDTGNVLQSTPFENQFGVPISPAWLQPLQEVSPVVRASLSQEVAVSSPRKVSVSPASDLSLRVVLTSDHVTYSSVGDQEEEEYEPDENLGDFTDADADGEDEEDVICENSEKDNPFLRRLQSMAPGSPLALSPLRSNTLPLQSPCKILPLSLSQPPAKTQGTLRTHKEPNYVVEEPFSVLGESTQQRVSEQRVYGPMVSVQIRNTPSTPNQYQPVSPLSPLTPLTPLTPSTSCGPSGSLDIVNRRITRSLTQKRRFDVSISPAHGISPKKVRLSLSTKPSRKSASASVPLSSPPGPATFVPVPIYSTRSFPPSIEMCMKFALFYRRYPISSYFQPAGSR